MDEKRLSTVAHTRVPHIVADWVEPCLSSSERDCLRYILRRTVGFADPEGGRKARDTISLDQFVNGVTAGDYVLDLGTGLTRNTVKEALAKLEEKELVETRLSCVRCKWEQQPGDADPPAEEGARPLCPRCRRTLSKSWALSAFTPRKVKALLNAHDPQGRTFIWESESKRFRVVRSPDESRKREQKEEDLREEALRLRNLLWYKKLVDEACSRAEQTLKAGRKITLSRRISTFYKPILELQEKYSNPALLRYALEETIAKGIVDQPSPWRWYRYTAKICANKAAGFTGGAPVAGTNAAHAAGNSPRARELAMREMLAHAAERNDSGDAESARAVLSDILAQAASLADLFDGDRQRAENSLREAFKQGRTDFVGVKPQAYGIDHYPEWTWPEDQRPE